jgi:hypothetical protein
MTKLRFASTLGAIGLAFATAAVAGDATIYSRSHFEGRALRLQGSDPNIGNNGFDNVGSIVVHSGRFEFCSRPGFDGRCAVLGPGRYASLREDWDYRVLSVRDLSQPIPEPMPRVSSIELYPGPGFRGPMTGLDRNVRWLERRGLDERISSLVVNDGVWELCSAPRFEGSCRTFGPGQYARLGPRLDNQVSSLRRVG